jgi:hypothetical protein
MEPEEHDSGDPRPGWSMYVRGRKLLQHCSSSKTVNLDLVRYHTLGSLYMMNSELLQSASHAIATAIQLAMVVRLNDEALWGDCSAEETASRRKLWLTIYFLDRKISQRNGTPYLIRDSEVAVDEFEPKSTLRPSNLESVHSSGQSELSPNSEPSLATSYFQFLVNFSKLWGQIWDTFYAAVAPKRGDWREVEIMDTRILLIRRQLPLE